MHKLGPIVVSIFLPHVCNQSIRVVKFSPSFDFYPDLLLK